MSGPSCYLEAESCADVTVILVEFVKTLGLISSDVHRIL